MPHPIAQTGAFKMKQIFRVVLVAASAVLLVACSGAQTDKFIDGVQNFTRGVAAVDQAMKDVNATLYSNCASFASVAESINDIAGQCSKAAPYTSTANAVINKYCSTAEISTNGGIAASIQVTASAVSTAKSVLAANKKACSG